MSLQNDLERGVVEIKFTRRRPAKGKAPTRRMYATQSNKILQSNNGRLVLNFLPGKKSLKYNPTDKGLILVWDIIMQDYRMVPANASIIQVIPNDEFWEFFNREIHPMSVDQKINFMNS